jgi:hypothetical protein
MSSLPDRFYSPEYIQFIRACLINACYLDYCKEVYNNVKVNNIYAYELLIYRNDKTIWDKVFQKNKDVFLYYLELTTDHLSILPKQPHISYSPTQTSNTYEQITFQEFVDERVNLQKVGYREYQTFTRSMTDPNFKKNLIDKYKNDSEIISLKNYLIYVIQMILSKYINNSEFFTVDEVKDMDITMNPIPYFEHQNRNSNSIGSSIMYSPQVEGFIQLEQNVTTNINTV